MGEVGELSVFALASYIPVASLRHSRFESHAHQVAAAVLYQVTESRRVLPGEP